MVRVYPFHIKTLPLTFLYQVLPFLSKRYAYNTILKIATYRLPASYRWQARREAEASVVCSIPQDWVNKVNE